MVDMDEPDFRAAVEASLREHGMHPLNAEPASENDVVDLTNDSESDSDSDVQEVYPKSNSVVSSDTETGYDNDELERALAMSMETCGKSTAAAEMEPAIKPQVDPPVRSVGLSGMDRKQMEQERLARLAKRKAESNVPTPPAHLKRKAEEIESTSPAQPNRKARDTGNTSSASREPTGVDNASQLGSLRLGPDPTKGQSIVDANPRAETRHHASPPKNVPQMSSSPNTRPGSDICQRYDSNAPDVKIWPTSRPLAQWPLGAVKKTHLAGFPRVGSEITIEEVIQREDLELGVFSSFLWDMEWFFRKLNTASSRFILMMQANDQETRDEYLRDVAGMPNLRLCFPPMEPQVSCMHSKLMLLFHRGSGYLRIVVPTANLTSTDWGENGLMENTVFLIDLPKIRDKSIEGPKTPFYENLVYFLKASTLNQNIIDKLKDFDFTESKRYAFVHSVGGSNTGEKWRRTGHSGLGRAVKALGLASDSSIKIDYVTSSMGSLNAQFLRAIYLACKGDDGLQDYNLRAGPRANTERKRAADILDREALTNFRVYFPSDRTVREAHENPTMTAGTICFNPKWWSNATFPRNALHDCESERGVLMHNKIAFVYPATPTNNDENERPAWAYVGSANLSESAWGRLVKDRTTNELKMNCRNWECGVVVPVPKEKKSSLPEGEVESVPLPVTRFQDIVPVPMRVPATQLSETRRPFFYGV